MLTVNETWNEQVCVVTATGEVDAHTAHALRDVLVRVIAAGGIHLVVDLSAVTFIDSSGLGVLVGRLKDVRARGGNLHLVVTNERVLRVLAATGLDMAFTVYATVDAALPARAE